MDKKKIIITVISIIVAVIIVSVIVGLIIKNKAENGDTKEKIVGVTSLYDVLKSKTAYQFNLEADEKNKISYLQNGDKAYLDTIYQGEETKTLVRDGNTYLVLDARKVYYTYANNATDLYKIENALEEIKDLNFETGKETIENIEYDYEEYNVKTDFSIKALANDNESESIKTRFYFKNNKLSYIKTIMEDSQELLKVDISYDVDTEKLEIPSNYRAM